MNLEINKDKIKILICCHKKTQLPNDEMFLPIHGGAKISSLDLNIQRDDSLHDIDCDNISEKNSNYCELTVLYWAWKNIRKLYPKIEYIGLNHYRRFFYFKNSIIPVINENEDEIIKYKLNSKLICKYTKKKAIIVPKKVYLRDSIKNAYCHSHYSVDYKEVKKIIYTNYNEYYYDFKEIFDNNSGISFYNMFLMPIEEFDKYCEFIFGVLFELEQKNSINDYNDYQKRIYGFMAERLSNVFFYHEKRCCKRKIIYRPVITYCEKTKVNKFIFFIKTIIKKMRFFLGVKLPKKFNYLYP